MDKETKDLLEELKNCTGYISVSELVEHLEEVDEYYNHEPWNLTQIIANINLIIPIEIKECAE